VRSLHDDEHLVLAELVKLLVGAADVAEDRDLRATLVEQDRVVRSDTGCVATIESSSSVLASVRAIEDRPDSCAASHAPGSSTRTHEPAGTPKRKPAASSNATSLTSSTAA
jgi:hypothetical protein